MKANNSVNTAYDENASRSYDQKRFTSARGLLFNAMEVEQLQKVLFESPPLGRVLEVGCGTGRFAEIILRTGRSVTGIDPSPYMIEIARNRCCKFRNATFLKAEGSKLPFANNKFDFTYSIRVLNQTESEEYALRIVKEIIRVTKPGGWILIEFCNKWRPRRFGETGVRLSVPQVVSVIKSEDSTARISKRGILFLSETLLRKTPVKFLGCFQRLDSLFSALIPCLTARSYIIAQLSD